MTPIFKFGSHLPCLIKCVSITDGPILEMGMGYNSSLFLHWVCATHQRPLVSYENDKHFFRWCKNMTTDWHRVIYTEDWVKTDIEKPWDVVLLDHGPAERRVTDVLRLANLAKYIIIHDSEGRSDKFFHYRQILPLFKYQYNYTAYLPHTSILSNFVDLKDFQV